MARTLILGLGNPLLGDDGVGWRVAEECAARLRAGTSQWAGTSPAPTSAPNVEIDFHAGGGLSLMERLIGYDRAILIDAITTGEPLGTTHAFPLEELPTFKAGHLTSSHDMTLRHALELGKRMDAHLPDAIFVVAVEARVEFDFKEELSPAVAEAVPRAVELVVSQMVG